MGKDLLSRELTPELPENTTVWLSRSLRFGIYVCAVLPLPCLLSFKIKSYFGKGILDDFLLHYKVRNRGKTIGLALRDRLVRKNPISACWQVPLNLEFKAIRFTE